MKEPNEFTEVQKQLCQILTRNFFYTINFWEEVFLSKKYANDYQISPFFIPPREI